MSLGNEFGFKTRTRTCLVVFKLCSSILFVTLSNTIYTLTFVPLFPNPQCSYIRGRFNHQSLQVIQIIDTRSCELHLKIILGR